MLVSFPISGNHPVRGEFRGRQRSKMMSRNTDDTSILQKEIRKQIGSAGAVRFARSLPAFQVDKHIPERLAGLLAELDRKETRQRKAQKSATGSRA